jgi:hypothetical protein
MAGNWAAVSIADIGILQRFRFRKTHGGRNCHSEPSEESPKLKSIRTAGIPRSARNDKIKDGSRRPADGADQIENALEAIRKLKMHSAVRVLGRYSALATAEALAKEDPFATGCPLSFPGTAGLFPRKVPPRQHGLHDLDRAWVWPKSRTAGQESVRCIL